VSKGKKISVNKKLEYIFSRRGNMNFTENVFVMQ